MEWLDEGREFLKAHSWERHRAFESDQRRGVPMPPIQKPVTGDTTFVSLVDPERLSVGNSSVRRSSDRDGAEGLSQTSPFRSRSCRTCSGLLRD